jgi:hypothetical protein
MQKAWWLHSFWALSFGVGVMVFARRGLDYADKLLTVLGVSWLLVFVAFRFVVGAQNRRPVERLSRRGLRLLTNYVIKQLYQQMFFFLVPLYASSATWSLASPNWWIVPLLLLCAVLSTMDLVFDNFIMEHRILASGMYALCMFGVLNLILPLVFQVRHFDALVLAAAATAPTVGLLSFRLKAVLSVRGIALMALMTCALVAGAFYARQLIPPAPMATAAAAFGHGRPGEFECVPGMKQTMRADRLRQFRCVTRISAPGDRMEGIVHVWRYRGREVLRASPVAIEDCGPYVFQTSAPELPADPTGVWSCVVETEDGQLVGRADVRVIAPTREVEPGS